MEIQEFVKEDEVDPIYLESSYYMAPDEGGGKPYALLFEALRQSSYYGIAKVSMHNREHVVILRPSRRGIMLHTMYYVDEVRQVQEFRTDTDLVRDKELDLAKTLITALAAKFDPEKYHDTYRENLQKMIEAKIEGRKVVETPAPQVAPVVDIMEALKRSLAERKKPVQAATTSVGESATAEPARKRTRRKAS